MAASLYDRIHEIDNLARAWRAVRRGGGIGFDGQSVAAFERRWPEQMAELAAELRDGRYHPLPLRGYLMRRPDGRSRPISLLALRDRIVQRAVLDVVQPLYSAAASPAAFGALPGRGVGAALVRAEAARRDGLAWIARGDIRTFFEQVDHQRVLASFRATTGDHRLTALVEEWLALGLIERPTPAAFAQDHPRERDDTDAVGERTEWRLADAADDTWMRLHLLRPIIDAVAPRAVGRLLHLRGRPPSKPVLLAGVGVLVAGAAAAYARRRMAAVSDAAPVDAAGRRGTPQGAPLSPLLATGMLGPVDAALDRPDRGQVLVRYIDDLLIICRDEAAALRALADAEREVGRLGLALNPGKAAVQPYDAGFIFLGAPLPRLDSGGGGLATAFRGSAYWQTRELMRRARRPLRASPLRRLFAGDPPEEAR